LPADETRRRHLVGSESWPRGSITRQRHELHPSAGHATVLNAPTAVTLRRMLRACGQPIKPLTFA
jgi:hypothetical protein